MIAIVDSGGANISSIVFALDRLNVAAELTADPKKIITASHVILPGVGAAKAAMQKLQQLNLITTLQNLKQPVLGICLGMQLMYESSEEGNAICLGIIPGRVAKFKAQPQLTIPHMGWNKLRLMRDNFLLKNIADESYVYFVHSYIAPLNEATCASANYQQEFTAVAQHNNFFATQFHPERSGEVGQMILRNFLEL